MTNGLHGLTIMNTRASHQQDSLSRVLKQAGAAVIELPLIRVEAIKDLDSSAFYDAYQEADIIVFTSANAVDFVMEILDSRGTGCSVRNLLKDKRLASVGRKTQSALHDYGLDPKIIPDRFDAEHLADALINASSVNERILYPRSLKARTILKDRVIASGRQLTDIPVYDTVDETGCQDELIQTLESRSCDIVTFASPSAVHSFFRQTGQIHLPQTLMFGVIGSVTEEALRRYVNQSIIITPESYTTEGLVNALCKFNNTIG